jgi:amino acid transporter
MAATAEPTSGDRTAMGLLGRPTLSTVEALAESFAIGPISAVGLITFLIAGAAGSATPLVVVIVFAGSLGLAWAVSLYGRRYAGAGTVYEYIARAHGKDLGVPSAGIYVLAGSIEAVALASGLLFENFCQSNLHFDPGWWTGAVGSIVLVFALNYLDIRLSVRTMLTITGLSAVPMLLLAAVIIVKGGASGNTLSVFDPGDRYAGDVFQALLFGVLIFAGFESAACVGEETRLPHRSIPRAILLSVILCGAFFVVMIYAATIGFGPAHVASAWGGNPVAFAGLGDRYVGMPMSAVLSLAILIDNLAVQIALSNVFARGYLALARDGLLPARLARVSRHQTPVGGLVAVAVIGLAVIAAAALFHTPSDVFDITVIAYTLSIAVIYLVLAIGSLRFIRVERRRLWLAPVIVFGAAVPALAIYGTLHPFPTGVSRDGVWLAAATFAVISVWFVYVRARLGWRVLAAGERAITHA